jgi:iron complex outermembrane receptor protein
MVKSMTASASLISMAAAILVGQPASAQSAPPAATSASDQSGIEDIVVTASRRSTKLQDTPLAISAVTGEQTERTAVANFRDLVQSAPSISTVSSGGLNSKIVLRGISSGSSDANTSAAGFYLNDTPLASSYTAGGTDLDLYDIARVEILRGPQGTLYGGGAMGGTVRVITNEPDATTIAGSADVIGALIAEKRGYFAAHGMINIPLVSDRLALRAVAGVQHQDGFITDPFKGVTVGGRVVESGRVALAWSPTSRFLATLTGIYQYSNFKGLPSVDENRAGIPLYGDLTQSRAVAETGISRTRIANLALRYDFGWATLTSSTSIVRIHTIGTSDNTLSIGRFLPGAPLYQGGSNIHDNEDIEEVRLASTSERPFSWVVGLFYQYRGQPVYRDDNILSGPLAGAKPLTLDTRLRSQTYAAFGELVYWLTPKLSLTGGLRVTKVNTQWPQTLYGLLLGRPTPATALSQAPENSTSSVTPKAQLTYKISEGSLVYVQAAKGFRPGGPNLSIPGIDPKLGGPVPSSFKDDYLWNYEVGAKLSFFNRRLTLNGAAYYIDWKNIQTLGTTSTLVPFLANGGSAISKGLELEMQARPDKHWTISLSAAYTDAHFTENSALLGVKKDDRIPYVPHWSGSASIEYRAPLSGTIQGYAQLTGRYVEGSPVGYSGNLAGLQTGSYAIGDAYLGITVNDRIDVSLFAKNFTDRRAQLNISADDPSNIHVTVAQPRTLGVRLSGKF